MKKNGNGMSKSHPTEIIKIILEVIKIVIMAIIPYLMLKIQMQLDEQYRDRQMTFYEQQFNKEVDALHLQTIIELLKDKRTSFNKTALELVQRIKSDTLRYLLDSLCKAIIPSYTVEKEKVIKRRYPLTPSIFKIGIIYSEGDTISKEKAERLESYLRARKFDAIAYSRPWDSWFKYTGVTEVPEIRYEKEEKKFADSLYKTVQGREYEKYKMKLLRYYKSPGFVSIIVPPSKEYLKERR